MNGNLVGSAPRRSRLGRAVLKVAAAILAALLLVIVLAAAFPWHALGPMAARRLSAAFGRPVTIGDITARDRLSLRPTLELADVTMGQPRRAGPGPLAHIRRAELQLPLLPLLIGHFRPNRLLVDGVALRLRRDAQGRDNWSGPEGGPGKPPTLPSVLAIRNGRLDLVDLRRHMRVDARFAVDPVAGIRVEGTGQHRGRPMTLTFAGAPLDPARKDQSYPFALHLASPLLHLDARGRMARPLDLAHMAVAVAASGPDARDVDDVIEAGLPGTQPVAFTAAMRRDEHDWRADRLRIAIGRSRLSGWLTVRKRGDRTAVDGRLAATRFDFDDLASDEGRARAEARRRLIGDRVMPETPISLTGLAHTDATIRFTAARLLVPAGNPFRTLSTLIRLDHRRLTLAPLTAGLAHGVLSGRARVDHRQGEPLLILDLRVQNGRLSDVLGRGDVIDGPFAAHVVLAGHGQTIRAALGHAGGRIGVAAPAARMSKAAAVYGSGNVIRGLGELIGGGHGATRIPACLLARFAAADGRVTARTLVVDTPIVRSEGHGQVRLPGETIELAMIGQARHRALLGLQPRLLIGGTLSHPVTRIEAMGRPQHGGLLGRIGAAVGRLRFNPPQPALPPLACGRLATQLLR